MRICATCQWLTSAQECRRFPPALTATGRSGWPTVKSADSCGEWKEGSYELWSEPGPTTGEKLSRSVAKGFDKVGRLSRDASNRAKAATEDMAQAVSRHSRKATAQIAVWGNALLATDAALATDRWLRQVFDGPATIYDKAMDAAYNATHVGGGSHRLFDGGHDLLGAWEAVSRAATANGDTIGAQIAGYASAVWKDLVTPKGLPVFTLDKAGFDAAAQVLSTNLGISREWLADIASFTATEVVGASVAAAAAAFGWGQIEIEKFTNLVGSFGLTAIASANPLLGIVAILCLAQAVRRVGEKPADADAAIYGMAKGVASTGAVIFTSATVTAAGGPVLVGALVGVAAGIGIHRLSEKLRYGLKEPSFFQWEDVRKFLTGSRPDQAPRQLLAP